MFFYITTASFLGYNLFMMIYMLTKISNANKRITRLTQELGIIKGRLCDERKESR
ncbi:MAG: hypothetical protein Q8936_21050 [Bacillota bacterium]|nr:hypothetical protein [Bacillota bacterium]